MELVLHRAGREVQARRDLLVGKASGGKAGDLELPGGEGGPSGGGGGQGGRPGPLAACRKGTRASSRPGSPASLPLPAPGHGRVCSSLCGKKDGAKLLEGS